MFAAVLAALASTAGSAAALGQYVPGSTGVDVSFTNCGARIPNVSFGVVGVSAGTGYSANPCLGAEAAHFTANLSLYVNTGWYAASSHIDPSSPRQCAAGDQNCLAYNYGYNAGLYALSYATSQGVHSSTWWLDVETANTWSSDATQNRNSLQGEYDALISHGATTVGVYSTTGQWHDITADWVNGWPSWGATTWSTAKQARTYCTGHMFTGGPSYLMQFGAHGSGLDQDVAC